MPEQPGTTLGERPAPLVFHDYEDWDRLRSILLRLAEYGGPFESASDQAGAAEYAQRLEDTKDASPDETSESSVPGHHWHELVYLRDWLRKRTPADDPGLIALDLVLRAHGPVLPTPDEIEGILRG